MQDCTLPIAHTRRYSSPIKFRSIVFLLSLAITQLKHPQLCISREAYSPAEST